MQQVPSGGSLCGFTTRVVGNIALGRILVVNMCNSISSVGGTKCLWPKGWRIHAHIHTYIHTHIYIYIYVQGYSVFVQTIFKHM